MENSRIAVIDDDPSARLALSGLLRSYGFDTNTYASAEEFTERFVAGLFRCIITDIYMPGMSGLELKAWLDCHQCWVPVIMITGRTDPLLEQTASASGAICLLRKPFDSLSLWTSLQKARVAN